MQSTPHATTIHHIKVIWVKHSREHVSTCWLFASCRSFCLGIFRVSWLGLLILIWVSYFRLAKKNPFEMEILRRDFKVTETERVCRVKMIRWAAQTLDDGEEKRRCEKRWCYVATWEGLSRIWKCHRWRRVILLNCDWCCKAKVSNEIWNWEWKTSCFCSFIYQWKNTFVAEVLYEERYW